MIFIFRLSLEKLPGSVDWLAIFYTKIYIALKPLLFKNAYLLPSPNTHLNPPFNFSFASHIPVQIKLESFPLLDKLSFFILIVNHFCYYTVKNDDDPCIVSRIVKNSGKYLNRGDRERLMIMLHTHKNLVLTFSVYKKL